MYLHRYKHIFKCECLYNLAPKCMLKGRHISFELLLFSFQLHLKFRKVGGRILTKSKVMYPKYYCRKYALAGASSFSTCNSFCVLVPFRTKIDCFLTFYVNQIFCTDAKSAAKFFV